MSFVVDTVSSDAPFLDKYWQTSRSTYEVFIFPIG